MIGAIVWSIVIVAILGLGLALGAFLGLETGAFIALMVIYGAFAVVFANLVARRIVKPIQDFDPSKPGRSYSEIAPLMDKITRQGQLIDLQMTDLKRSREEFQAITSSMAEGFILVDPDMKLISYNPSAQKLMGDGEESVATDTVRSVARAALAGEHTERTVDMDGHVYQVLANPVESGGKITGAIILSLDITEKARREAMRHDFSSNVSHELKTPLTSIYGISELMVNGMVKPEDMKGFATSIHDESGRLIALINDIIKLSQLDDGVYDSERTTVDLYGAAKKVVERLAPVGAAKGVEIHLTGSPAQVMGVPSVIDEMIYNLCDNAIKYNVENGRVLVSVATIGGHPAIAVSDTGIGIPREHIDRVFERFYRVDKSHSKKIGGTGLGLSIVKHGAAVHNADVNIKSNPGRGTAVTVTFPIPKPEEKK